MTLNSKIRRKERCRLELKITVKKPSCRDYKIASWEDISLILMPVPWAFIWELIPYLHALKCNRMVIFCRTILTQLNGYRHPYSHCFLLKTVLFAWATFCLKLLKSSIYRQALSQINKVLPIKLMFPFQVPQKVLN